MTTTPLSVPQGLCDPGRRSVALRDVPNDLPGTGPADARGRLACRLLVAIGSTGYFARSPRPCLRVSCSALHWGISHRNFDDPPACRSTGSSCPAPGDHRARGSTPGPAERREENGIAHFLEHLVFTREKTTTTQVTRPPRMALCSTPTLARPRSFTSLPGRVFDERSTSDRLRGPPEDRPRRARPRARRRDPEIARPDSPSCRREHYRPRRVAHPLADRARPASICELQPRGILAFRGASWRACAVARSSSATRHLPDDNELPGVRALSVALRNGGSEPAPPFSPQTLVSTARRTVAPADLLRPRRPRDTKTARRSASTPRSGGSMGAAVRRDPRAARSRLLGVLVRPSFADVPSLHSPRPGLEQFRGVRTPGEIVATALGGRRGGVRAGARRPAGGRPFVENTNAGAR